MEVRGGNSVVPKVLLSNQSISIPENTTHSFDSSRYFENVSTYRFVSADGNLTTDLLTDDINISLVGNNLTVITAEVETTSSRTFTIKASDKNNNSIDTNITVEVVDTKDDQAIVVSGINISTTILVDQTALVRLSAVDMDNMQSVIVLLKNSDDTVMETRSIYVDNNLSQIEVSEDFTNLAVGRYSFYIVANGVIGGEGDRSSFTQSSTLVVREADDTPYDFDFLDQSNLLLNRVVTTNTIAVVGIDTTVSASTSK